MPLRSQLFATAAVGCMLLPGVVRAQYSAQLDDRFVADPKVFPALDPSKFSAPVATPHREYELVPKDKTFVPPAWSPTIDVKVPPRPCGEEDLGAAKWVAKKTVPYRRCNNPLVAGAKATGYDGPLLGEVSWPDVVRGATYTIYIHGRSSDMWHAPARYWMAGSYLAEDVQTKLGFEMIGPVTASNPIAEPKWTAENRGCGTYATWHESLAYNNTQSWMNDDSSFTTSFRTTEATRCAQDVTATSAGVAGDAQFSGVRGPNPILLSVRGYDRLDFQVAEGVVPTIARYCKTSNGNKCILVGHSGGGLQVSRVLNLRHQAQQLPAPQLYTTRFNQDAIDVGSDASLLACASTLFDWGGTWGNHPFASIKEEMVAYFKLHGGRVYRHEAALNTNVVDLKPGAFARAYCAKLALQGRTHDLKNTTILGAWTLNSASGGSPVASNGYGWTNGGYNAVANLAWLHFDIDLAVGNARAFPHSGTAGVTVSQFAGGFFDYTPMASASAATPEYVLFNGWEQWRAPNDGVVTLGSQLDFLVHDSDKTYSLGRYPETHYWRAPGIGNNKTPYVPGAWGWDRSRGDGVPDVWSHTCDAAPGRPGCNPAAPTWTFMKGASPFVNEWGRGVSTYAYRLPIGVNWSMNHSIDGAFHYLGHRHTLRKHLYPILAAW
jgi:hypothetical protein